MPKISGAVAGIYARESCPSYPDAELNDFDDHKPLSTEMRCAYCGERLNPYPCGKCAKFLTTREMHEAYMCGLWSCATCLDSGPWAPVRCHGRDHKNHVEDVCNGDCCTACGGPIDEDGGCRC